MGIGTAILIVGILSLCVWSSGFRLFTIVTIILGIVMFFVLIYPHEVVDLLFDLLIVGGLLSIVLTALQEHQKAKINTLLHDVRRYAKSPGMNASSPRSGSIKRPNKPND